MPAFDHPFAANLLDHLDFEQRFARGILQPKPVLLPDLISEPVIF
jgi:hypothetical protein